ncbi:DUF2399 domain-containing protein [Nocardia cyriacigeorgica]|uniref:DUF2399 domain-containing protein n=1 Tax=Nocardia cyriacigeorgica TaxID=135487 RepID=UPI001893B211|nr:DUF2399 domain-containing protein [Nocardia cyriacigeorgica]MBF6439264.1 DUF2399 domain-containing protein [Nocardia cyriacigeorgica]
MADVLPEGLRTWANLPGPAAVLTAIRRRARRGAQLETGSLRVDLTAEERRQVARVLGTDWEVSGRPVSLKALSRRLADHGLTVRRFVEAFDGAPLVASRDIVAAENLAAQQERLRLTQTLTAAGIADTSIDAWLSAPRAPRLSTGQATALADHIAVVWQRLPWAGPRLRLAQLAAITLQDAHALDYSTDLGRAVARLIAAETGIARPTRPGREWRAAWAAAGIRCDTVSSRVLTLNVPLDITAGHRRGAPQWLTLRDMTGPWDFAPAPPRIYVCENPTVIEAAADELGPDCPPLICTDGVPSLAALDLLASAADREIAISVRADIDPAGFMIVETLRTVAPASELWRFDTVTYTTYSGIPPDHADLTEAHRRHGRDVHEEAILDLLLDDLRDPQR